MKLPLKLITLLLTVILIVVTLITLLFGYRDIPLEDLKAKYTTPASAFVKVDGMDVHYRDEGEMSDSIPIVLLHGTASSLHTYDQWASQFKKDYRVVRMDLAAFGLTGPFPNRDYSVDNYVSFLHDFLTAKGIDKCILAGNSLGGAIAWNFTAKHPEMVDKLILIDASGYPTVAKSTPIAFKLGQIPVLKSLLTFITPRFLVKSSVENVYADKSKVDKKLVDRYFDLTLRKGNRQAFVDRMALINQTSNADKIKQIQQPTLIIWGEQDLLIPVSNAHLFHEDLPKNELVILKNSGHVPMEESPAESLEKLLSFLKRNNVQEKLIK